jgi:hypothetical protein
MPLPAGGCHLNFPEGRNSPRAAGVAAVSVPPKCSGSQPQRAVWHRQGLLASWMQPSAGGSAWPARPGVPAWWGHAGTQGGGRGRRPLARAARCLPKGGWQLAPPLPGTEGGWEALAGGPCGLGNANGPLAAARLRDPWQPWRSSSEGTARSFALPGGATGLALQIAIDSICCPTVARLDRPRSGGTLSPSSIFTHGSLLEAGAAAAVARDPGGVHQLRG